MNMMILMYYKVLLLLLVQLTCFSISKTAKQEKNINKQSLPQETSDYYEDDHTNEPSDSTDGMLPFDLDEQTPEQYQREPNGQTSNQKKTHPESAMSAEQKENQKQLSKKQIFSDFLFMDPEMNYFVQWKTNKTHITFEVQVKTLGWVGLGLSPTGGMTNSDIAVMWVVNGKLTLQDRFAKGFYEPLIDEKQDWIPLYGYENDTHTVVGFSRLLDTCDMEMDRPITRDTVHLLYAYHSQDPPNQQLMKHEHRGSRNVYLLDSVPDFVEPDYTKKIVVRANKYKVPHENDTTYRCFVSKLKNIDKKYHLIGVKPIIPSGSKDVVHHMLLHLCDATFKNPKNLKQFMCYEGSDATVLILHCFSFLLGVWAVGGPGYLHPKDLGFPMDIDLNGRYVVLETHYNNPNMLDGIVDSSGVSLYLTDKLRKIETGQLFMGSADFNWGVLIPPKQKEFSIYSICDSNCTSNMEVPEEGLNIFSFFLHTHLAGRKIRIRIIRDGKEIETTMKDDNFDFNYQENRNLAKPIKLMKGDSILTECIYSSENRTGYTFGGLRTSDEMCLIYLGYYPKTDFTVCASMINVQDLSKVIGYKNTEKPLSAPERILSSVQLNKPATTTGAFDTHVNKDVSDLLNTKRGRSLKQVRKLAKYYREGEYDVVCRYMSLPQFMTAKLPEYAPYVPPPTTCESTEDDYE